jgi:hypothetical protein
MPETQEWWPDRSKLAREAPEAGGGEPGKRPASRATETREWWGKPEEARKSPFAYLTALRQSPPGTRSWG